MLCIPAAVDAVHKFSTSFSVLCPLNNNNKNINSEPTAASAAAGNTTTPRNKRMSLERFFVLINLEEFESDVKCILSKFHFPKCFSNVYETRKNYRFIFQIVL